MKKKLGKRILWRKAQDYLTRYKPMVIAVTGSTGKTTTKQAIALALGDERRVHAGQSSYNTPVGVALSILGVNAPSSNKDWYRMLTRSLVRELAREEPDTLVLEFGADQPGDIDWLASHVSVNIGVVTNVGTTHTAKFVDKETVAHEKTSLVVTVQEDGVVILNTDDPLVAAMAERAKAKVITFGEREDADVQLVRLKRLASLGLALEVKVGGRQYELHLKNIIAKHQVDSVLAALAVAQVVLKDVGEAVQRLQALKPPAGRMRLLKGKNKSIVIDDTYNASPESTMAALKTLQAIPASRRIAILGDMLDLGGESISAHKQVGKRAGEVADMVMVVGEQMRGAGAEAVAAGADVHQFQDSRDVGKWLETYLRDGDVVLVKGSRLMAMEKAAKRLVDKSEIGELYK